MARLPQWLKELAVLSVPPCMAERMAEEWQAHLAITPGLVAQTVVAAGFLIAAVRCGFAARFGAVTKTGIVMSPRATECAICGEPIMGESPGGELKRRKPCPRCGSFARKFFVQVHFTAAVEVVANLRSGERPNSRAER